VTAGREADPDLLDALPDLAGERVLVLAELPIFGRIVAA
jgi:hypothetical protein